MYICIYICMYIYMCVYMYVYICVHIYIYIHIHTYIYTVNLENLVALLFGGVGKNNFLAEI